MGDNMVEKLSQMPGEMIKFTIDTALQRGGARLGSLIVKNRAPVATPNYVSTTSRGVVPHLSQDNLMRHTKITSLYFGLEDFIEKKAPPIYNTPITEQGSRLRTFTAQDQDSLLILGPRRLPSVVSPLANTNNKLSICTSVGFLQLPVSEYLAAGESLRPDIFLAPGDAILDHAPSQKRAEKMGDRTAAWLRDAITIKEAASKNDQPFSIFAPILPLEHQMQNWYLRALREDFRSGVDGIYVHDAHSVVDLPEQLQSLLRLALTTPTGPSDILYQISFGIDLFATPFTSSATDAGIALTFTFPASKTNAQDAKDVIGINLWHPEHATSVSPFVEDCTCYACQKHHRAYLHHLLSAKEMLAWTLLQIHNHSIMEQFFAGVRASLVNGTFDHDREVFDRRFEAELPVTDGVGPRVRGYEVKATKKGELGDAKKNVKAFNKLDDVAEALAEAARPSPSIDASELQDHGLGKSV